MWERVIAKTGSNFEFPDLYFNFTGTSELYVVVVSHTQLCAIMPAKKKRGKQDPFPQDPHTTQGTSALNNA